jgi:hypothetical protein
MNTIKSCFACGAEAEEMYGYLICEKCKSKLGLFTDDTIKRNTQEFMDSSRHSYLDEINRRLDIMDKDYIKKRIKLLHIKDRLENFGH